MSACPEPTPFLLDAAGHACVAWWHAAPAAARPLAVVLASSWGEEDISAYDGQRALAMRLAEAGLATLRFEWPDTGDSSAETGRATVADLLAAFAAAADAARARSGGARLAFVGLRLGALLAAQAAAARDDVEALVGLLPVASGRAFVREQQLLGAGLRQREGATAAAAVAPTLLGGFALGAPAAAALNALKWPTSATRPVPEALLLSSPDAITRAAADALASVGTHVTASAHAGLERALAVAHQARLVPAAVDEIVRWLTLRAEAQPAIADVADVTPDAPGWMSLTAGGVAIRERVCRLAGAAGTDDAPLVGVLAESAAPAGRPRRGLVLLSSGRERRVGPHRLWVPFARARAARGDVVLRLDIAAVGDSPARATPDPADTPLQYDARAVRDLARAVDWLRREHGVGACAVMGVCSGAYHAWRAALAGVDVQRVVAINPLVFHWQDGLPVDPVAHPFGQIAIAADAVRALRDPARWWKLLRGRADVGVIARALAGRARRAGRLGLREIGRALRWPLRDDLAAELARTADRGVALDFVFSAHEPGLKLLREESGRRGVMLERDKRIKVCQVEHADHTFAGTQGRLALYARLESLLDQPPAMSSTPHARPSALAVAAQA